MTLRALVSSIGLLTMVSAMGCFPPRQEREDPVAETMRMLADGDRVVRSGGTSQNVLVRMERISVSAEDAAGLAALWRYADGGLAVSEGDGLASGGVRLALAGARFKAELSAWTRQAGRVERSSAEIVVQSGSDGLLLVARDVLVPVLTVFTPSGKTSVLRNERVGVSLGVRPRLVEGGRIELDLRPSFATVSGPSGEERYSLDALSSKVCLGAGETLLLGSRATVAEGSAAAGLFGFGRRGERIETVLLVSAERL